MLILGVLHAFSLNFDVNRNLTLEITIKGHFPLLFCFTEGPKHFHNAKENNNNHNNSEIRSCKKGQTENHRDVEENGFLFTVAISRFPRWLLRAIDLDNIL